MQVRELDVLVTSIFVSTLQASSTSVRGVALASEKEAVAGSRR